MVSRNWWAERIPEDVRRHAEDRQSRNERPWPWSEESATTPLHFVDFADYSRILTRRDNWRDAFRAVFQDEEILRAKLRELESIRNDVAHSRDLSPAQRQKLRIYESDLVACIKKTQKSRI